MPELSTPIARLAVALAIGLLLGAERERRMTNTVRGIGGIRTFALTALLGGICEQVGGAPLVLVGIAIIGVTAVVGYLRAPADTRGVTTEVALVIDFLLGVLAQRDPTLASALGVAVTVLLAVRVPLHRFVSTVLTDQEVHDALLLVASAVVILPLLPDRSVDPWAIVNPARVFRLAVLLMLIMAAGYASTRALGARAGLPLSGLLSGFVSSASTVASMGARVRLTPEAMAPAVAGAVFSSVATAIQLAAVLWTASPALLSAARWPLLAAGSTAVVFAVIAGVRARRAPQIDPGTGRAFDFRVVTALAAFITLATLISAIAAEWFGAAGVAVAAALGGLADVHATAIGIAALVAADRLSAVEAVPPLLYALTTNTVTKLALALAAGGPRFALPVGAGLLLMLSATWFAWGVTG